MAQIKINNIIYGSNNSADIIYKNTTVEEKLDTIPVFDINDNSNVSPSSDYLTYGHIIDNLNSSATDKILSANQGRVLKESIENSNKANKDVVEELSLSINELNSKLGNPIQFIHAESADYDMDAIFVGARHYAIYETNDLTLGTPFKYGVTGFADASILSYSNGSGWGLQFAFMAGSVPFMRTLENGNITDWTTGYLPLNFGQEINDKLGGLRFGIDANGNYGYYKVGADTVTPFNDIKSGEAWLRSCRKITTSHNYTGGMTGSFYIDDLDFSDIDSFIFSYSIGTSTKGANTFRIYNSNKHLVNVDPARDISNQIVYVNNTTLPCTVQISVSYSGANYLTIHSYIKHGVIYYL